MIPSQPFCKIPTCFEKPIDGEKLCGRHLLIYNEAEKKPLSQGDYERDNVNHPSHYTFGSIEVIDAIEDWKLGFHEANTIKYIARAKHKGRELEDLKKARWYLNRKIEKLEEKEK